PLNGGVRLLVKRYLQDGPKLRRKPGRASHQTRANGRHSRRIDQQSRPNVDRSEGRPKLGPSLRTASQGRDSRVRGRRIQIPPSLCRTAKREGQVVQPWKRKQRSHRLVLRTVALVNCLLSMS